MGAEKSEQNEISTSSDLTTSDIEADIKQDVANLADKEVAEELEKVEDEQDDNDLDEQSDEDFAVQEYMFAKDIRNLTATAYTVSVILA